MSDSNEFRGTAGEIWENLANTRAREAKRERSIVVSNRAEAMLATDPRHRQIIIEMAETFGAAAMISDRLVDLYRRTAVLYAEIEEERGLRK